MYVALFILNFFACLSLLTLVGIPFRKAVLDALLLAVITVSLSIIAADWILQYPLSDL